KCTSCDGTRGGQRGQAGRFPAPTGIFIVEVPEPPAGSPRLLREPTMFRPPGGDDTKLRWDETVFRTGEDIRKPALDINRPSTKGRKGPCQGTVMIKALSAVALGAFVAAGITV